MQQTSPFIATFIRTATAFYSAEMNALNRAANEKADAIRRKHWAVSKEIRLHGTPEERDRAIAECREEIRAVRAPYLAKMKELQGIYGPVIATPIIA